MSRAPELAASAMERRNARLYLIGLGLSMIGDTALSLVAGMWVKSLTGSSALAGLTQTCIYIPSLFGPLAGLVADRVPRNKCPRPTCRAVSQPLPRFSSSVPEHPPKHSVHC